MARKRTPKKDQDPKPRRRRRRMPLWQKAVLATLLVMVCFGVFLVMQRIARPITILWNERKDVHMLEAQLAASKKEQQALLEKRRYLRSPEGAEIEARKLGYVKPGEVSIMIEDKKEKEKEKETENR